MSHVLTSALQYVPVYSFYLSFSCISETVYCCYQWGSCSVAASVWSSLEEGQRHKGILKEGAAVNISLVVHMTLTRSAAPLGLPQISP